MIHNIIVQKEEILIELNKFYCADSVEFIQECIPNNFVDLTVTSPPYDNLRTYKGYVFDYQSMLKELYRITKIGGVVVWVVNDATIKGSETGTSFRQALYAKDECGFNLYDTMIYDKNGFRFPHKNIYHQVFEYMFIFSKGKPKSTNMIEDRVCQWGDSHSEHWKREPDGRMTKRKGYDAVPGRLGKRYNIWRYSGANQKTKDNFDNLHPAIFPEKLAEDHILSWSNEGDVVLDPMCGSGTTCKMSFLNNRNFIGIDCSEEYIKEVCIPRLVKYGWNSANILQ
jgi:DNA modification methylase